jgi:asparagine synthase (glutamine-hydrolysing)
MCGIVGFVSQGDPSVINIETLRGMAYALNHRGPDESGEFIEDNIALAHKRLSIIDLKEGQQPMRSERGNVIVFNGEIYNYIELKKTLIAKGFIFRTNSDTEVLLASYEAWGKGCLEKLNGMFSFLIYDKDKKSLFFSRDRLGKKPFYYFKNGKVFAFASEIKALLALPEVKKNIKINPLAISDFLSLGYILSPKTIYDGIEVLQAANYGVYNIFNEHLKISQYWNLEDFYHPANKISEKDDCVEKFEELLFEACKLRLRSDVPLGTYLSGGLDSASIAAIIKKISKNNIQAFTVGFESKSYDETKYAKMVSKYLDIDHALLNSKQFLSNELSKLVWYFDGPFADTSIMPTYMLNNAAKKYATVALSGDGADEMLAGYQTYLADKYFRLYKNIPLAFQKKIYYFFKKIIKPSYRKVSVDYKLLQFLSSYGFSIEKAHYWWRVIFSNNEKKKIMSNDLLKQCGGYDPFDTFKDYFSKVPQSNFLDKTLFVDQKTWLQDNILVKVDRSSMANSMEVRSPFLDHNLVEYVAQLQKKFKLEGGRQKMILKSAMKPFLQQEIINRKKSGFNSPTNTIGETQVKTKSPSNLFSNNFLLRGDREDITYKAFSFAVLGKWLDMHDNYLSTGRWEYQI